MRPEGLKSVFLFRRHDLMSSIKKRLWPVRVGCVIDEIHRLLIYFSQGFVTTRATMIAMMMRMTKLARG